MAQGRVSRINDGNCISLALNKGYGWAGDVNLRFVFEKLFCGGNGLGYPESRSESQKESRGMLARLSAATHSPMEEILPQLLKELLAPIAGTKAFMDLIDAHGRDGTLKSLVLSI